MIAKFGNNKGLKPVAPPQMGGNRAHNPESESPVFNNIDKLPKRR